jgi:hypothetical protein
MAEGAKVYRIDQSNIATVLPQLTLNETVKSDISNAVAAGKYSIVPERGINSGSSQWTGYYIIDPVTGAGAYLIDGGYNGGNSGAYCPMKPATQPVSSPVSSIIFGVFFLVGMALLAGYAVALAAGFLEMLVVSVAEAAAPNGSTGKLTPDIQKLWDDIFSPIHGSWPNGPSYPGDGLGPYGRCSKKEHSDIHKEQNRLCTLPMSCDEKMDCPKLQEMINNRMACITKRLELMATCFEGGDGVHWGEVAIRLPGLLNCQTCLNNKQATSQCSN